MPPTKTLQVILLVAALIGYLLPWATAPAGSMTLNAFDLAEWVSLHPSQRQTVPPLQVSLLLRLQLVILCTLFAAVVANQRRKPGSALLIIAIALAQLPPPEFVLDPGNLNYRQQFGLALVSLLAGLLLLRVRRARLASGILVILPWVGAVTAVGGVSQALAIYDSLQTGGAIGLGVWILVSCYAGLLLATVVSNFKRLPLS